MDNYYIAVYFEKRDNIIIRGLTYSQVTSINQLFKLIFREELIEIKVMLENEVI